MTEDSKRSALKREKFPGTTTTCQWRLFSTEHDGEVRGYGGQCRSDGVHFVFPFLNMTMVVGSLMKRTYQASFAFQAFLLMIHIL
jgi:hypothetical protein